MNRTKLEEESINLLKEITFEQEQLESLYLDMAKNESGEIEIPDLDEQIENRLQSLQRSANNINRSLLETEMMKDELKARKKDVDKKQLPSNTEIDYQESKSNRFAKGVNIYKLLLILFFGSFAGVIVEMLFCLFKNGYIESRTSTIIGPFNLVYGLGAACLTFFLYKYRNHGVWLSFIGGFVVGSVVEYFCSYFQELLFGSTSWDYSGYPFNINGRICLLYSIFWGLLGIFWIKDLYPLLSQFILKISNKIEKTLTIAATVFLILDYAISGFVVYRWMNREQHILPQNKVEEFIDVLYPNETMKEIYPNLVFKN
ncbi:putative ABC transporter permease [Floccifex sp.]|uniref:putative ABC transporter permease n=1 Tax=Floccifex sp. TaxID=2815810 RepID=UPI003EFCD0D6